jgi:FADH2 O2-dependent halogenase
LSDTYYDVAVVGSGFAGSLLAMIAKRQGKSVVLIERGKHPRFAMGESSTPLANLLLETLAIKYDLPGVAALSKWGTWQESYPEIDCGLKRGFTFYHHEFGKPAARCAERGDQLLVAASPNDRIADTHWNRADVDAHFLRQAQSIGVDYIDEVQLETAAEDGSGMHIRGTRHGQPFARRARFLVDATGPRGFLHRALQLPEAALPDYPATHALYSHFRGVRLMDRRDGETPPYPPDDAALHHVFDGGWIWMLRFKSGIVSAGVAATHIIPLEQGESAWRELLEKLPSVKEQFADAVTARDFTYLPRLSFRSAQIAGSHWAQLPSAAGFVDPLLSTGFPLTMLGVMRLADVLERGARPEDLCAFAMITDEELLATSRLIANLYRNMNNFPVFAATSLLYFAAASYAETARRLDKAELASSFLLNNNALFREQSARAMESGKIEEILHAIEPFNVAGLGKKERRNWYPALAEDLKEAAPKLGAASEEIEQLLQRCGF